MLGRVAAEASGAASNAATVTARWRDPRRAILTSIPQAEVPRRTGRPQSRPSVGTHPVPGSLRPTLPPPRAKDAFDGREGQLLAGLDLHCPVCLPDQARAVIPGRSTPGTTMVVGMVAGYCIIFTFSRSSG